MTIKPSKSLPRVGNYRWVSLWSLPLRITHWFTAFAVVLLAVTGLYIGRPYFLTGGQASAHYLMGWVRFTHFVAAGVLVMAAILRIYWLFAGDRYERWSALFPLGRKNLRGVVQQVRAYLMVRPEEVPHYLSHNPLQQLSYTALYGVAVLQTVTGFALFGQYDSTGEIYRAFNWIGPLFGGMPNVRFIHHVITWVFACYVPIHIYLSIRADMLEHNGTISSMITGGRVVPADAKFQDD